MPGQPLGQHLPRSGQAHGKGTLRPAELSGRLLVRLPLQIAQNEGNTILVRQSAQLLVQHRLQIIPPIMRCGFGFGHQRELPLPHSPFCSDGPPFQCRLVSHAIQPVADHLFGCNGSGLADKHQEGRLESVVGVVIIPKKAAAYSQDHRAMPAHESFESRFVPPLDVMFQQLDVAQVGSIVPKHGSAKVLDSLGHLAGRHILCPRYGVLRPLHIYFPVEGTFLHFFSS